MHFKHTVQKKKLPLNARIHQSHTTINGEHRSHQKQQITKPYNLHRRKLYTQSLPFANHNHISSDRTSPQVTNSITHHKQTLIHRYKTLCHCLIKICTRRTLQTYTLYRQNKILNFTSSKNLYFPIKSKHTPTKKNNRT